MNLSSAHKPDRAAQRGNAMLLVLLLTTTALGVSTVAYRATDDAIRVEDYQRDRDFRDQVITSALAGGVQLLRTGEPLVDPLRYVVPYVLTDASTFYTLVEIKKDPDAKAKGSAEPYIVTARRGNFADAIKYGLPPLDLDPDGDDGDEDEDDDKEKKDKKDKKEKSNSGLGWGVGGIPPGADKGKKGDKD